MSAFLLDYGLFLAKTVTLVVAIGVVIAMVAAASRRGQPAESLRVDDLNDRYRKTSTSLQDAILPQGARKAARREEKAARKARRSSTAVAPRSFVLDFKGDLRAQAVSSLREEVSAVLAVAGEDDEVILRLENAGGTVHEHGLAAAQLIRLRDAEVPLTVVVDKVAASGGYLMACVANRIVAAPFAIIGSIGVLAQLPNFRRLLDEKGVHVEQVTAGEYKRTVTMFGENTDADRAKLKSDLEEIHALFKAVVARFRPELDLAKVSTGEYWHGTQALELGLIDQVQTSDALLVAATADRELYALHYEIKQPLQKKLLGAADSALSWLTGRIAALGLGRTT